MRIAVFGKRRQGDHLENVMSTLHGLAAAGVELAIDERLATSLDMQGIALPRRATILFKDNMNFVADMALSIGGDGTLLRTAHRVADKNIPILGINTGTLGYLSADDASNPEQLVDEILNQKFVCHRRGAIAVYIEGREGVQGFALNEVAVMKEDTASMISVQVSLDDLPLATYAADGILLSTPTGSTAYNISVGGPIVQPDAPVWVLAPVAAHSLTMRPLIVTDTSILYMRARSRQRNIRLSMDGWSLLLPSGTGLMLRKAPFDIGILYRSNQNWPQRLRSKLNWGK